MLTAAEIKPIAEAIIRRRVAHGVISVDVALQADSFGDPAIFVVADVEDAAAAEVRRERMAVTADLRASLVEQEEDRFPFFEVTSHADREEAAQEDAA